MTNQDGSLELIGNSSPMRVLQALIRQVAHKLTTVLILGESGTGKELVARVLHDLSDRKDHPFVPVNCAAIPSELLESELFGHEKGSFTGAFITRQGRFELANGGTLFLDEIGDMPLTMQAKLLRVLQERCFERVGGSKLIKANVRIIAATHKNLENSLREGSFREDLFYRLNVFPIEIPPLRARKEDISVLSNHFIETLSYDTQSRIQLNDEVIQLFESYDWPGNVRELSNIIERLQILYAGKTVTFEDLQGHYFRHFTKPNTQKTPLVLYDKIPKDEFDLKEYLAELEYTFISQALDEYQGIVAKAAKRLGIQRTTLVEKMKKYGISREIVTKHSI